MSSWCYAADSMAWVGSTAWPCSLPQSDIVRVDTTQEPPAIAGRLEGVGTKAHGLVPWRNHLIMLDSDNGALIAVTPGDPTHPGGAPTARRLWKAPEEKRFLKGLAVMDDVAYFGVSAWAPRAARDDPSSNCQLAAYDLVAGKLLWRREVGGIIGGQEGGGAMGGGVLRWGRGC